MTLFSAVVMLFLVMDALGNVPVFLATLRHLSPQRYRQVVIREMFAALVVLLLFLFFGHHILAWMKLTPAALSVAGGLILLILSIKMIFPQHNLPVVDVHDNVEVFIVPLAVPMVAGPTAMTIVMLMPLQAGNYWIPTAALCIAWSLSFVILLSSDFLRRKLKDKGLSVLERLMGMILVVLAVQMILDGIQQFFGLA